MAIEFHCPYCTAVMRVPDEFAAKQGRCPKCDTVVVVPDVRPPEVIAAAESSTPAHSQAAGQTSTPAAPHESGSADPFAGLVPVQQAPSIARSLKKARRRGPQRVWLVGVPVIFFLILLSAISWYVMTRLPALSGQLAAAIYNGDQLPPKLVSWSAVSDLTDDQIDVLRGELELAPEAFVSTQMRCQLSGATDGIEISLRTTEETAWYVIDPSSHAALVLWLRKNRDRLSTQRNIRFQNALRQYCRDKMQVINGQAALIDAEKYRNSVGLDGCCAGFGSVVEVVVSNRVIRCAAEDEAGRLYFCLPRGVVNFQLRGKTLPDGSQPFAGQFDVSVDGMIEPPADPSATDDEVPDEDTAEGSADDQSTEMEEPDNSEPSGASEQD